MNPHIQRIFAREIDKALQRHGLSDATAIRNELQARARVGQGHGGDVRIDDGSGVLIPLDQAIEKYKGDARFRQPDPPRVPRSDWQKVSENLDRIARGEVSVE